MIKSQCHCGNIKLQLPQLTENATSCNCSICARYGAIWGYFTRTDVKVTVGESGFSACSHGDKNEIKWPDVGFILILDYSRDY